MKKHFTIAALPLLCSAGLAMAADALVDTVNDQSPPSLVEYSSLNDSPNNPNGGHIVISSIPNFDDELENSTIPVNDAIEKIIPDGTDINNQIPVEEIIPDAIDINNQ
ncbi:MAG: hypothetical protein ACWIPH_04330, partial [Ostreibacterium sp.]